MKNKGERSSFSRSLPSFRRRIPRGSWNAVRSVGGRGRTVPHDRFDEVENPERDSAVCLDPVPEALTELVVKDRKARRLRRTDLAPLTQGRRLS